MLESKAKGNWTKDIGETSEDSTFIWLNGVFCPRALDAPKTSIFKDHDMQLRRGAGGERGGEICDETRERWVGEESRLKEVEWKLGSEG